MNSQNVAVGFFEGAGNLRACRWIGNGVMEDLAVGLPLSGTSQAVAVNEHGVITGYMGYTSYPPPNPHTFILNNDQITEVEVPFANAFGSQPSSINNKSHICGYLWVESPDYPYYTSHAFFYDGKRMIDLPRPSSYPGAVATGLNDRDQIVGVVRTQTGGSAGVIWMNGQVLLLRDLVPEAHNWYNVVLNAINSDGHIVGNAFDARIQKNIGFVLTPQPPRTGDVNCDALVNIDDLVNVITQWGQLGGPADLNDDSVVNLADLVMVLSNWSN